MSQRRLALIALALLIGTVFAPVAAIAAEEEVEETTTTTTFAEGQGPAVVVPPIVEEETEAPWTERFLIPTLVITGILIVGGVALYYFARVKNRYRVVG